MACLSQPTIRGKVISRIDKKPIANASVFLSNATIGNETGDDGSFTLYNVRPGEYHLVVSVIGFETYHQDIKIYNNNVTLPDIQVSPKITVLKEVTVKIKVDPNRGRNYEWFKENFLGTSELANKCKILNPEVLDLIYKDSTKTLTASSDDFLVIENEALGYKIRYLLTDFSYENKNENEKKILYEGAVFFEEMKGSDTKENRWKKNRQDVYKNSPMHFLRSALNDELDKEGFLTQKLLIYDNPDRPSDSLINAKLTFYKSLKTFSFGQSDSLSYWIKKSKLPKKFSKLTAVKKQDIIKSTNQPGQYDLSCETSKLFVAFNKTHRYHIKDWNNYLYNPSNDENTLIKFNSPDAFFYSNGVIVNPYSVIYYGVWGRHRVAEQLPINYLEK